MYGKKFHNSKKVKQFKKKNGKNDNRYNEFWRETATRKIQLEKNILVSAMMYLHATV